MMLEGQIRESIERSGFCYVPNFREQIQQFLSRFGSFAKQYNGRKVWHVRVRQGCEHLNNSLGQADVQPHTEYYETVSEPPRYVALYCVEPAKCGGGEIGVFDLRPYITACSLEYRNKLETTPYLFTSETGLQSKGFKGRCRSPILTFTDKREFIVRFCVGGMSGGDDVLLRKFRSDVLKLFPQESKRIRQERGSLLIWNNHQAIHSRINSFTDSSRHLLRYWIS